MDRGFSGRGGAHCHEFFYLHLQGDTRRGQEMSPFHYLYINIHPTIHSLISSFTNRLKSLILSTLISGFKPNHLIQIWLTPKYIYLMSSSILKYGQIIRIRSYEKANTFLTSKSYTDQNLYFQVYDKSHVFTPTDLMNVTNYRESLFEVLPTSSFEIND